MKVNNNLGNLSNGSCVDIFGQTGGREGSIRRFVATVRKCLKFETQRSGRESAHAKQKTEWHTCLCGPVHKFTSNVWTNSLKKSFRD